jgi:anti-sigma regulatory factor (Ser/Thr protein kinase)
MQTTRIPDELRLDLPADPGVLSATRRLLRRWLRERGADEPVLSEVALAVNEACANAIEHAYAPGPASFHLRAVVEGKTDSDPATVVVTVTDTGRWRPPRGENRGRGLTIIETAMDDFQVDTSSEGTEVVMRRRIGSKESSS